MPMDSLMSTDKIPIDENEVAGMYVPVTQHSPTRDYDPSESPTGDPIIQLENGNESDSPSPVLAISRQINFQNSMNNVEISIEDGTDDSTLSHASSINLIKKSDDTNDSKEEDIEQSEEEHLLCFLKSSKKENRNLSFRCSVIMSFCPSKNKIDPAQFFSNELRNNILFHDLTKFYRKALLFRQNQFRVEECAEILLKLWLLKKLQDDISDGCSNSSQTRPLAKLSSFIESCLKRISLDLDTVIKNKRKRSFFKEGKCHTQTRIVNEEGSKWTSRIEPHSCPKCGHGNLISVVPIEVLVERFSVMDLAYKEECNEYKVNVYRATHKKDGTKRSKPSKIYDEPKRPIFPKQIMACMCTVTKCRNVVDGRGCHHCLSLSKSNIDIPYNVRDAKCECALCACDCDIEFPKSSWQGVAAQAEEERMTKEKCYRALETCHSIFFFNP